MSYLSTGKELTSSEDSILESIAALTTPLWVLRINAAGTGVEWAAVASAGASTALDNLASVAINTTLVSDTDNTDALGTISIAWSDLFLGNGAVINFTSSAGVSDVTITHSSNALTIAGGDLIIATSIGATGTRVLKGWFTDLEVTNAITGSITGNAATVTTNANLSGHITSVGNTTALGSFTIAQLNTAISDANAYYNGGTDVAVADGGTGLSTITALSILVANSANTFVELTPGAGNSIRINAGGTAWEAFTPSAGGVPTTITVADEAADATSFLAFFTAATGDLGPKTNTNMTFNSSTGVATFASTILTTTDINGGTIDGAVIGGASAAAITGTTISGTTITASVGFALGDGDYIGVTSNEILTFATAGTITASGADFLIADGNGFLIGHTAQLAIGGVTAECEQFGTAAADATMALGMFNATAGTQAEFMFYRSKNAAIGSATVVASGDGLGKITWYGAQQTGTFATQNPAAQIRAEVDGTVTSGAGADMPGRIIFSTTADASGTLTDRLILDALGVLKPNANDGVALGTTALSYSDLFLASGAVINFANGNAVITHSSAILTVSTGDLRVTTAGTNAASVVTLDGTQTLGNKTLTAPKFADLGFIADANGNELFIMDTVTSAVNEITVKNAATTTNPGLTATGGDTNVGIDLTAKGAQAINIRGNATQAGELRIYEDTDDGTNYSALRGSARSADITYTMPTTDPTAGQVLSAGAPSGGISSLSWTTAGGGAWTLVAYSSTTSGISATISSLDLSTDLAYKVIFEVESDGSTNQLMVRVNAITTSTYSYIGNRTYWSGSAAQELRSSGGTDAWYAVGGNASKSYYGEFLLQMVKAGSGGTERPNISGLVNGFATGSSDTYFQNFIFNGFQSSQTNITSLFLGLDGGTNANIRMWVLKPKTA